MLHRVYAIVQVFKVHFIQLLYVVFVNSPAPGQNGRHFTVDNFKHILMNEKFCISIRISLKVIPNSLIDNESALIQVMAWRRAGDKPLPEPLLTHFTDAYMWH